MLTSPAQDPDYLLYQRIRGGDKSACAECIERHSPEVYRLAFRWLGDTAEAEDVVQETFLNAFKAIQDFEWRSDMKTWLYRIAHNAALARLRQRQYTFSVDAPTLGDEATQIPRQLFDGCCLPERDFETAESRAQVEQAIASLPEKLRLVFVLRELEGLSTEDTAKALGISSQNVKVRLHRARLQLREKLAAYFTELTQTNS